jgi:glycine cleavage system H protein
MSYPSEFKYTDSDQWLQLLRDGGVRVGVTNQKVRSLTGMDRSGEIVYVTLPAVGAHLARNTECGALEGDLALATVPCPIAGTVVDANGELTGSPDLVRQDAYGDGWLFTIKPDDAADLNGLMTVAAYSTFVGNNG